MFGFIGSGATAGWIIGGFVTRYTATRFGAESSLIGMAVCLVIAGVLVDRLWLLRPLSGDGTQEDGEKTPTSGLRHSLTLIAGSPYLRAIAGVILLSSWATAVIGWQFKAVVAQSTVGRDELAAFFGMFNFYAGLAVVRPAVGADGAPAAPRGPGLRAVRRAGGADAGHRRAADRRHAGRGGRAARHRPGAAVRRGQADGRAAVPAGARGADAEREVVHRHRGLAARRRAGRPLRPAVCQLGRPGAGGHVVGDAWRCWAAGWWRPTSRSGSTC